jgi:hypothetical protein
LRKNKVKSHVFFINDPDPNTGSGINATAGSESGSEINAKVGSESEQKKILSDL